MRKRALLAAFVLLAAFMPTLHGGEAGSSIRFELHSIPFILENDETTARNIPETMAGGVAVFDYDGDGRPDIFFTNGGNLATLKKDDSKYRNRLFRNEGNDVFTDVTEQAHLAGTGFDTGVAVADYDNDGHPDLFVAGVHHSALYHNNGDGTFTDATLKSGLDGALNHPDPEFGPLWAIGAAWVDINNDGFLDLFVVNYLRWQYATVSQCGFEGQSDYCPPGRFQGAPNQLFLNNGDGTFRDVSKEWGIRSKLGKGMSAAVADFDKDGKSDIYVTNDGLASFLFHNQGNKFREVAFETGVALPEDGSFVSGMGLDFRDYNNDSYPDIAFVAVANQTFPIFQNVRGQEFDEETTASGMRQLSWAMNGFGLAMYDFDNDGWKDLFVTRGDVDAVRTRGRQVDENNTVFRNLGATAKWQSLTAEAGFAANPPARHRGCAFGDLDGDGRIDAVVTALGKPAEIWMNRSSGAGHWLEIALRGTKSNRDGIGARIMVVSPTIGAQFNHMTSAVCYASSSYGPVHFGLGPDTRAERIEITWPSGKTQVLRNVSADQAIKVTEPSQ